MLSTLYVSQDDHQAFYFQPYITEADFELGPGGYLQWLEVDAIDCFATPETQKARDMIAFVVAERVARGLTLA